MNRLPTQHLTSIQWDTNIYPAVAESIRINFGGFVPLSTVDWRGRSSCVVFFRGCPVKCWYCQNQDILTGENLIPVEDVMDMIRSSSLLLSGVVFSGGEATMQSAALKWLANGSKKIGLYSGLHTNGIYPNVIRDLIENRIIDHIALDIKAEWNLYTVRGRERHVGEQVKESLSLCTNAYHEGALPGFEVVVTLFPGYGEEIRTISRDVSGDITLILQQGVVNGIRSLGSDELMATADRLNRTVRIRTRTGGEIQYEGNRNSRDAGFR